MRHPSLLVLCLAATVACAPLASADPSHFFESNVRPIFEEHCTDCHGPTRQHGGLRLDQHPAHQTETGREPFVIPGDATKGLLIRAIQHTGDISMPKDAPKLAAEDIALIEQWISSGAWWPETKAIAPAIDPAEHWAYRPLAAPGPLPEGRHPIDAILDKHHQHHHVHVSPLANPSTRWTRLWLTLTGLLPPENEPVPNSLAAQIDTVLASPHFGERWARHWMDVVRYADTKGYVFQENRNYPYAYTYRDWLIRSFNDDLPYGEFIRRQLAADLLQLPVEEHAALGFITTGRRFLNDDILIADDRLDVTFRGIMATTLACARCHDHKSDPFTARDYYGIFAIFKNLEEPAAMPLLPVREENPNQKAFEEKARNLAEKVFTFVEEKKENFTRPDDFLAIDRAQIHKGLSKPDRDEADKRINALLEFVSHSPDAPPRAMIVQDAHPPPPQHVFVRGSRHRKGDPAPRALPAVFRDNPTALYTPETARLELAHDLTRPENHLTARVWAHRVWTWATGQPLADSPSDFGFQTPPPLHLELLDHLALTLQQHNGSTKALLRHIVSSDTWQRSNIAVDDMAERDPENIHLARAPLRRKEFETFRDTVLQVSGQLDARLYGRSESIHEEPFTRRRTVYAHIDRQNLPAMFRTFDFPDPNAHAPRRPHTSTPNQALFLLNSPWMLEQASALAAHAKSNTTTAESTINRLYHLALRRAPSPNEHADALTFVSHEQPTPQTASDWSYGYGAFQRATNQVDFTQYTVYTGSQWQDSEKFPAPPRHYAHWSKMGGHPGNPGVATILRWTAPESGTLSLHGTIERPSTNGVDGVELFLVSDKVGLVAEWIVEKGGAVPTSLDPITVQEGESLYFVVDSGKSDHSDSFRYSPTFRWHHANREPARASEDFSGPAATSWTLLAQLLLASNEFMFVE